MTTTRLYLQRHCDVRNPQRVLYGHLPNFPLSDKGVRQAHRLGEFYSDKPIKVIYASPLERAQETASIIASYLKGVDVVSNDDLIEAKFSKYLQGVRPRDVPWRRPLWFVHKTWPGLLQQDESVREMATRVDRAMTQLLAAVGEQSGICVSHGDPIQSFWHPDVRRFLRLDCGKGGHLEVDYVHGARRAVTYVPPPDVGDGSVGIDVDAAGTPEPDEPGQALG